MEAHPAIADLVPFLGIWRGQGHGGYPTGKEFDYADELEFSHTGKPFVAFVQRTRSATGQPMHTECGYLRAPATGEVEIVVALPTGQTELGTGTVTRTEEETAITTDAAVVNTPTAKQVDRIVRAFRLNGDELSYELSMEAVGQPLSVHLRSHLTRV